MDLIELIAQEMAKDDDPVPVFSNGVWYNEEVHETYRKRARAAHRVIAKRGLFKEPKVLQFLRVAD